MLNYLIKHGHVIDTISGIDKIMDIGIVNDKIADVGSLNASDAIQVIDAQGCYVTPGLVDYHIHVNHDACDVAILAEAACFPNGVTAVVDGGSTGVSNYEAFYKTIIATGYVDIKSLLHVSSVGQTAHGCTESVDPALFEKEKIIDFCKKYNDNIVGLKLRSSKSIVRELGLKPLKAAAFIAREAGVRMVVHISDSPETVKDTLDILSPGDVYCHAFHNTGITILDDNGKVLPEVFAAKKRGILFDAAHGSRNFSIKIGKKAYEQGFLPDIISSDLSKLSMYQKPTYCFDYIMSVHLNLGMSFTDIIKRCTEGSSKLIYKNVDGFIKPGAKADIAIFKILEKSVNFTDFYGDSFCGDKLIKCEMTFKAGSPVFRQIDFV